MARADEQGARAPVQVLRLPAVLARTGLSRRRRSMVDPRSVKLAL